MSSLTPGRTTQSLDQGPTDVELVERARHGEPAAFEVLYRRYAPSVGRRLRRLVYHSDESLDLLQQTFVEAHRSLARWRPDAPFEAWLNGIAFRVAGNFIKSRRRKWWQVRAPVRATHTDIFEPADQRASPDDQAASRQLIAEVYRVLDELPVKKRLAFCMYEFEGLDLAEIGKAMGASAQTTWARVESARNELRSRLGYGEDAPGDGLKGHQP